MQKEKKEKSPQKNDQNLNNQEKVKFCGFCKKKAEFKCSNCEQEFYCTPQHQKADWPSHKRRCIRAQNKLLQLKKYVVNNKKLFFENLGAKSELAKCEQIIRNIISAYEQILQKASSAENQIEYGSSLCAYVKILIIDKNFEAEQILNSYIRNKISFLKDTKLVSQKIDPEDSEYENIISLISGKLQLLSVLSNLTYHFVRNSVQITEVLLNHCQIFYGAESLEVSNVYFVLGQYFNFYKQKNKAIACFLVAGRIRKEQGVSCFYNTSIILMESQRYYKAIKYFTIALEYIQQYGDKNLLVGNIYEGLSYCYKRLNHFDNTVLSLEKALCENFYHKRASAKENYIKKGLKKLSQIKKKQFPMDQIVNLPKQKAPQYPQVIITNKNLQDFMNNDKDTFQKRKAQQWKKSFKKKFDYMRFQTKVPLGNPLVQKMLFNNYYLDDKNDKNMISASGKNFININLKLMSSLSSIQVRFLDELNMQLMDCKEKSAILDIVDNSKFMQDLVQQEKQHQEKAKYQSNGLIDREKYKEKIKIFYELNPSLLNTNTVNLSDNRGQLQIVPKKPNIIPPKLNLTGVNAYRN